MWNYNKFGIPSKVLVMAAFFMIAVITFKNYSNNLLWRDVPSRVVESQLRQDDNQQLSSGGHPRLSCEEKGARTWDSVPSWTDFYDYIEGITSACRHLEMFGGVDKTTVRGRDGEKGVCLDQGPAPTPGRCVVLSFGVNNEWSFDDAMESYGCEVYSFDPTMNQAAHTRGNNIHFQPLGLGKKREMVKHFEKSFEVKSYREILETIGKTNSLIDYLKIDIEGFERDFFQNVLCEDAELLDNIKQIGMEIHMGKSSALRNKYWKYIHILQQQFSPIYSDPNMVGGNPFKYMNRTVSACYEIVWINNRFREL